MLGDKAYDSAELRDDLDQRGTKPVIPDRCNRKQPFSFSKRLYKLRWRIGVSSQRARCHVGESPTGAKRLRLRSKGGAVARKQDGGALRQHARREHVRSIRLQGEVNADVASLHDQPVAETVDNARRQQGPTKGVRKRRSSPAGYQRRHDANDSVSTGETLDARRAKSRRRGTSYNREWEMEGSASGSRIGS